MDVAEKIDLLFKTVTKPDCKEYSYREVEELADGAVSSTSIWKARLGKIRNPSQRLIGALSKAFGVPVNYFFDEGVTEMDVPRYRKQYQSERMVEQIALRASELDEEGKQAILDMINLVRKAQERSGSE